MTKRFIAAALPLVAATFAMGQQIKTTLNGETVRFNDVQPVTINGRVLVPVRGIFEQMGVNVGWEPSTQTVYANGNGKDVVLYIGKKVARVDGQPVTLDVPATTYRGRTMVPLRFISESMGANVNWDPNYRTVAITTGAMAAQTFTPGPTHREHYGQHHDRVVNNGTVRSGTETTGVRTQPIQTVVLRANTVIPVTLNDDLSSANARVGDRFTANVDANGNATYDGIPSGTVIEGHVDSVRPMTSNSPGVLGLTFDRFRFPNG